MNWIDSQYGPHRLAKIDDDSCVKNYEHTMDSSYWTWTDTMAYKASALSFMLRRLGNPCDSHGLQIPLAERVQMAK